jgi:hypothetical protein
VTAGLEKRVAESPTDTQAVDLLARQVVAEVAPAELPVFSATAKRYHENPVAALAAKPKTDETLGFGAESVVVLLAPFALELAKRVLGKLSEKVGDEVGDSLTSRVLGWFGKGDDKTDKDGKDVAPLTADQLALVAQTARSEAAELALPPDQSERLADAVVAALATRA